MPTWKQAAVAVVTAGALLVLNDMFIFESVVIPSASMRPAILPNERVFLTRFPPAPIERFAVVVVDSRKLGARVAKRVIGLPGDRIRVEDAWKVFVNGQPLDYSDENLAHERIEAGDHAIRVVEGANVSFETPFARADLTLGPGEYFVLGDNRLASDDSRSFGPVTRDEIQGTLGTIWYSFDPDLHRLRTERLLHQLASRPRPT
jgi:signal peptidase I